MLESFGHRPMTPVWTCFGTKTYLHMDVPISSNKSKQNKHEKPKPLFEATPWHSIARKPPDDLPQTSSLSLTKGNMTKNCGFLSSWGIFLPFSNLPQPTRPKPTQIYPKPLPDLLYAADKHLQSWTYWQLKKFHDFTTATWLFDSEREEVEILLQVGSVCWRSMNARWLMMLCIVALDCAFGELVRN